MKTKNPQNKKLKTIEKRPSLICYFDFRLSLKKLKKFNHVLKRALENSKTDTRSPEIN